MTGNNIDPIASSLIHLDIQLHNYNSLMMEHTVNTVPGVPGSQSSSTPAVPVTQGALDSMISSSTGIYLPAIYLPPIFSLLFLNDNCITAAVKVSKSPDHLPGSEMQRLYMSQLRCPILSAFMSEQISYVCNYFSCPHDYTYDNFQNLDKCDQPVKRYVRHQPPLNQKQLASLCTLTNTFSVEGKGRTSTVSALANYFKLWGHRIPKLQIFGALLKQGSEDNAPAKHKSTC